MESLPNPDPLIEATIRRVQAIFESDAQVVFTDGTDPRLLIPDRLQVNGPVIAVACSPASPALVISGPELARQLVTSNPWIRTTLKTCWDGHAIVWFHPKKAIRCNVSLPAAAILVHGLVPIAKPGQTEEQFNSWKGELLWEDIQWDVLNAELIRWFETQAALGKPFIRIESRWVLNVPFWSRWLTQELKLTFDVQTQQLYRENPGSLELEPLTLHGTICLVTLAIQESAVRTPEKPQFYDLDLPQVYGLIERIKLQAAFVPMSVRENLTRYAQMRLTSIPGSSLTTQELLADHQATCSGLGLVRIPDHVFLELLPQIIFEQFRLRRSGDIVRERADGVPTARRGFKNLGFRPANKPSAAKREPLNANAKIS